MLDIPAAFAIDVIATDVAIGAIDTVVGGVVCAAVRISFRTPFATERYQTLPNSNQIKT